ncbi:MAG: redox-sensing transcriptional repressor Rex [candidate division NC10 bacterium]|nr:redox-sensing transcriptional repressor Rex [candidate division NC10 bacterium]
MRREKLDGSTRHRIPERTIARLSIYLRCLEEVVADGTVAVSSQQLAKRFGLNSAQVRKDLAYFGQFGVRGLGYYTEELKQNLERILGLDQEWDVALVGLGNLGSALLRYRGFQQRGFRISVVFDNDPSKVGRRIGKVPVRPVEKIVPVLRRRRMKMAVIAVPASAAQAVTDRLVAAGVNAILNFAPTQLFVPKGVKVQNVDLSVMLKTLSFYTTRSARDTRVSDR